MSDAKQKTEEDICVFCLERLWEQCSRYPCAPLRELRTERDAAPAIVFPAPARSEVA